MSYITKTWIQTQFNNFAKRVAAVFAKKSEIPTKTSQLTNDSGFKTTDTTYGVVSKTANGLAPKLPNETTTAKYLRQDGTWQVPPDTNTTYSAATQSVNGLMSADDKKKLDGIAMEVNAYSLPLATSSVRGGAKIGYTQNGKNYPVQLSNEQMYVNVPWTDTNTDTNTWKANTSSSEGYVASGSGQANKVWKTDANGNPAWRDDANTVYAHPTTSGNKHIPSGGSSGQILRWSADGTAVWGADNNTTYSDMTAATANAAGKAGLVPAPAAGNQNKYLRGDGTWQTPPDTNTTYSTATRSANGLMSANDKTKLDDIASGANKTSITNNLLATAAGTALDATQGKALNDNITAVSEKLNKMSLVKVYATTSNTGHILLKPDSEGRVPIAAVPITPDIMAGARIVNTYNYHAQLIDWNTQNPIINTDVQLLVLYVKY